MTVASGPAPSARSPTIPLCVPEIRGNEWRYLKECLDTGWVSSAGAFVDRFERQMADYVGVDHAVAVASGTAALHLALLVAGVGEEDEVLVPTLTFIAPVNAVRYAGAHPVFVDCDARSWQMDGAAAIEFLRRECSRGKGGVIDRRTGRRVAAILPVHLLGHCVDVDPLIEMAHDLGIPLIEDATESLGATCGGARAGSLGDLSCLSFNGNKLMTTGGGGMLLTNDRALADKARYLSTQAKDDPVEYRHDEIGFNYRLTNIQAAVGCAQIEVIEEFIAAKRAIAVRYREALKDVPGLTPMVEQPWEISTFWMAAMLVDEELYGRNSRELMRRLGRSGVETRPLWLPIHLNRPYRAYAHDSYPVAELLQRRALCLPCSVGLRADDQQRVIDLILSASLSSRATREQS